MLKCSDNTIYTGITNNIDRRIDEHNHSNKGAKYTKTRRPVELLYKEEYSNRSLASKREYFIKKKMSRAEKLELIK
jgi:putative endonuclease